MVYGSGKIPVRYSDPEINAVLSESTEAPLRASRHFSHTGDFFLRFSEPIEVPSYPIHHDSAQDEPAPELRDAVRTVLTQIHDRAPELLVGLTHIFDPSDISHPVLVRFFRVEKQPYAFLVRFDFEYRPRHNELIERTNNTRTASFRTRDLFVEMDLVPIRSAERTDGKVTALSVEQSVSETWIGETGRGYMRSGIWLDRDLSLFFSKLFSPTELRTYPYQIFTCKYRSIAHSAFYLRFADLRKSVPLLHKARVFLLPRMREIEASLRSVAQNGFNENLPQFRVMKKLVSDDWQEIWRNFDLEVYLNDDDKREFRLAHGLF
jgi:hypothetical protein